MVDCGISNDATRALWAQVFAEQLDGLPVLRVVVTHFHPDHVGLAHWLCARWDCRLWMSATDFQTARLASQSTQGMGGVSAAAFFASHGLTDPEAQAKIRARADYYPSLVPAVPGSYRRLMDGMALEVHGQTWQCISGHGHAPEHISLYNAAQSLLISGDMVLPRISTNVSVVDTEPEADPLSLYLRSLRRFEALPADTLVLPSHGRPFTGLPARLAQLHAHHDERLAEVLAACAESPRHAADLLPVLFRRPLDLHQTTFAMGEAVAHLHALWLAGRLRRVPGADGIYRFAA